MKINHLLDNNLLDQEQINELIPYVQKHESLKLYHIGETFDINQTVVNMIRGEKQKTLVDLSTKDEAYINTDFRKTLICTLLYKEGTLLEAYPIKVIGSLDQVVDRFFATHVFLENGEHHLELGSRKMDEFSNADFKLQERSFKLYDSNIQYLFSAWWKNK